MVKPVLELLAGIPSIVYGFFALVTVGPFLRDLAIAIAGGQGFIMAQSVLTAGLVMGVMLIPFVSSLSDDIITAVPRALRGGSLGAWRDTFRNDQARGSSGSPSGYRGRAPDDCFPRHRRNHDRGSGGRCGGAHQYQSFPKAMTTITVKIVNQLTGDLEFNSPQTLVAFALGITLSF